MRLFKGRTDTPNYYAIELKDLYQKLCDTTEDKIANVLSVLTNVHTKNFINDLLKLALSSNNYLLSDKIKKAQIDKKNNDEMELINLIKERFDDLFDLLYGRKYTGNILDLQNKFSKLMNDTKEAGAFDIAQKCRIVINDINKRHDILFDIREAELSGGKKWWEHLFDEISQE